MDHWKVIDWIELLIRLYSNDYLMGSDSQKEGIRALLVPEGHIQNEEQLEKAIDIIGESQDGKYSEYSDSQPCGRTKRLLLYLTQTSEKLPMELCQQVLEAISKYNEPIGSQKLRKLREQLIAAQKKQALQPA